MSALLLQACYAVVIGSALHSVLGPALGLPTAAPYGRWMTTKVFGIESYLINARLAWFVLEMPNLLIAAACWHYGEPACKNSMPNKLMLGMFVLHYINRTLIYPLRMKSSSTPMPLVLFFTASLYTSANAYLQSYPLSTTPYREEWLLDPRFVAGAILFLFGFMVNVHSDGILLNLRKPGEEKKYKIPRAGGMFEFVSGANFLGEIVEWLGYSLACWSLHAAAFGVSTMFNIGPRAHQHHRWYHEKFEEYPKHRKALIPFLW
ncbi:unnamed protein product [Chrysoparadoxa australica]